MSAIAAVADDRILLAADRLERDADAHAERITREVRKTIRSARAEVAKCVAMVRWFAEHASEMLEPTVTTTGATIRYDPLGTILGIMPWNFPYWQVFRFAIPALLAGNKVIVKPSPLVPQCSAAVGRLLDIEMACVDVADIEALIKKANAVVLTGGWEAGTNVAAIAGRHAKKVILELGGSDAFIVLPSADIDRAVATAVRSRIHCNGQACTAAKRFIVHQRIAAQFEEKFARTMSMLRVGNPFDERTDVGPLMSEEIVARLEEQVTRSIKQGARLLTGGCRLGDTYYAPTVLTDVPRQSPVAQEETFGPVAAVMKARDLDEAIEIANDTRYGLGASVWTADPRETERCAGELQVGQVAINAAVTSDPRLPFGGVKDSGFGRELGVQGIREFTNVKVVQMGRLRGGPT